MGAGGLDWEPGLGRVCFAVGLAGVFFFAGGFAAGFLGVALEFLPAALDPVFAPVVFLVFLVFGMVSESRSFLFLFFWF